MLFLIIYAAQASAFVRGLGDPLSQGNGLAVFFTLVMMVRHRVKFNNYFLVSIAVLVLYTLLTFIAHNYVSMGFIPRWFIYLSIAYVICQIYDERILCVIERILIPLVIISMIMWVFHLIFPSIIYNFVETYSLPSFSDNPSYMTYNCIIYTINGDEDRVLSDYYMFKRNAGFAFEPGAYSCLACLGVACNWIRNKNKLISIPIIIYLAAIVTSQSTTGVFIFGALLLAWMIINKKIWWAILLSPFVLYVARLGFVSDKFTAEYTDVVSAGGNLNAVDYHGRMFGLEASWMEFSHHPIIGLGGKMKGTFLDSIGVDSPIFSGIGYLLTTFGLILSVLYFALLFKYKKILRNKYNNSGWWYIIIVLFISMFSYQMWQQPLFLAFAFMPIYGRPRVIESTYKVL